MTARRRPGQLAGSRALVTGASGGIGTAIARRLAARGVDVVLSGRDTAALGRLATALRATSVPGDLASRVGVAEVVAAAGAVDVLVLAAGVGGYGALPTMSPDEIERLVAVDLTAPLLLARGLLPGMIQRRRGHLVFVGSVAGRVGVPHEVAYSAGKAGLHGLAEALRFELRGTGVAVTEIVPGPVKTRFYARRGARYQRSWPRPVPPDRVALAVIDTLEHGRPEAFVPSWLRLPVRLAGGLPALYRALAMRAM